MQVGISFPKSKINAHYFVSHIGDRIMMLVKIPYVHACSLGMHITQCVPMGPVEIKVEFWLWYAALPLATKVTAKVQVVWQVALKV